MTTNHNPSFSPKTRKAGAIEETTGGITLRDYFAGQAMMGMVNRIVDVKADDPRIDVAEMHQENISRTAYMVADAMLKERGAK